MFSQYDMNLKDKFYTPPQLIRFSSSGKHFSCLLNARKVHSRPLKSSTDYKKVLTIENFTTKVYTIKSFIKTF